MPDLSSSIRLFFDAFALVQKLVTSSNASYPLVPESVRLD